MNDTAGAGVAGSAPAPRSVPRFDLAPVGLWTGALEYVPAARAVALAAEAEELGYGAIWLPEVAGRDVFVHLALLLSGTSTLVGATGIASIWARDAVAMRGAAAGLTEAFPERVLLGLGVSHHTLVEGLRGHHYRRPVGAMREYLDVMDTSPYTSRRPTTPLRRVVAALGPKMLELAGTRAAGAHTYLVTPEHTEQARRQLGEGPLICVEQGVVLETDPVVAREVAREHLAFYLPLPNYANNLCRLGFGEDDLAGGGSDRLVDALVAWGSEEQVVARLQAQMDAGADHVCLQPLSAGRRSVPDEQWRRLAGPVQAVKQR